MTATTILVALLLGVAAGVAAGLFGVGGGILFVPALIFLDLTPLEAVATSLCAVVPTAAVGLLRQRGAGTIDVRRSLIVGVASVAGVEAGAHLTFALPEPVLQRLFAILVLLIAAHLVWSARRSSRRAEGRIVYPDGQ